MLNTFLHASKPIKDTPKPSTTKTATPVKPDVAPHSPVSASPEMTLPFSSTLLPKFDAFFGEAESASPSPPPIGPSSSGTESTTTDTDRSSPEVGPSSSDSDEGMEQEKYSLRKALDGSPTKFKQATSLPKSDQLERLWELPKPARNNLVSTYRIEHSYLIDRQVKDGDVHFNHSVVGAAAWENYHDKNIYGAGHRVKAVDALLRIISTLNYLNQALRSRGDKEHHATMEQQKLIMTGKFDLFAVTINDAIKTKDAEVIASVQRAKKKLKHYIDKKTGLIKTLNLSDAEKSRIREAYPSSPEKTTSSSPKKTPKRRSAADHASVDALRLLAKGSPAKPEHLKKPPALTRTAFVPQFSGFGSLPRTAPTVFESQFSGIGPLPQTSLAVLPSAKVPDLQQISRWTTQGLANDLEATGPSVAKPSLDSQAPVMPDGEKPKKQKLST